MFPPLPDHYLILFGGLVRDFRNYSYYISIFAMLVGFADKLFSHRELIQ